MWCEQVPRSGDRRSRSVLPTATAVVRYLYRKRDVVLHEVESMADDDEVELSGIGSDDEYEVVPMGPIRKLEKRIQEMESESGAKRQESLIQDMVDMMKTNQQMVNSMVQSTGELRSSVQELTNKMDTVIDNMNEFMQLLEEASEASIEEDVSHDIGQNIVSPITEKMDELRQTNEKMLEGLSSLGEGVDQLDKRMKRMYASSKDEPFRRRSSGRKRRRRNQQSEG